MTGLVEQALDIIDRAVAETVRGRRQETMQHDRR